MTTTATVQNISEPTTENLGLATTKRAVERLNNSLAKSSLSDLVKARTRRSLLLVDCSSSMHDCIRSGKRRIDALRDVVADLRETHPVPVAAFSGRGVRLVEEIPEPSGRTPLSDGIDFGRTEGANHLVVVTDGQPDSECSAMDAAILFAGPIDTFYIGDGNDRGARFCEELARKTGGTAHLTDLGQPKALAAKIAGFLGDGTN